MSRLYYTAPSQECFDEMKRAATEVWSSYQEESYRSEKLGAIEKVENIRDNFMYLLAMFDQSNQRKVGALLSPQTRRAARDRMLSGGMRESELPF